MLKASLSDRVLYYSLPLVALLIPTGFMLSYVAAIIGVTGLICAVSSRFKIEPKTVSYSLLAPALLYLVYAVSLIYTHNTSNGAFDLQVKLVMLLFPLFFLFIPVTKQLITRIVTAFIAGFILTMLCHYIHAAFSTADTGWHSFYYTTLTGGQHPAYLSMYGALCFIISAHWLTCYTLSATRRLITYAIIVFCIISIMLLGSKAGMMTAFILFFFVSVKLLLKRDIRTLFIWLVICIPSAALMQIGVLSHTTNRVVVFDKMLPTATHVPAIKNSIESTNAREAAYTTSLSLIKASPVYGYGCGDVQDNLNAAYNRQGLTSIADENLNAHNQYLQTTLALGLIGGLILLSWLISILFVSIPAEVRYLTYGFVILIAINLMFESMLERQAGIMFIMFWHSVLLKMKVTE